MLEAKIYLDDASETPLLATFLEALQTHRRARYATYDESTGRLTTAATTTAAEATPEDPPRVPPPGPSKSRSRRAKKAVQEEMELNDVPPVALETALEESDAQATAGRTPAAKSPAATEADAIAAMQGAVARGVPLPEIVALLTARNVARVTQLSPEDRATFVAALS